jgi:hypothetical protein
VDEAEWLACDRTQRMVTHLRAVGTSHRKLRLFACACCRRLTHLLEDEQVRKALEAAERYADDLIKDSTAMTWYKRACAARDAVPFATARERWYAYHAVSLAAVSKQYTAYLYVHRTVVNAVAFVAGHAVGSDAWNEEARAASGTLRALLRDVVGNPFRPPRVVSADVLAWQDGTVPRLARAIYEGRRFGDLPLLADALTDAGCDDEDLIGHCRGAGPHVLGCRVVDRLLGKF